MIRLKKHISPDGSYEYVSAADIFNELNEFDRKAQKAYEFLLLVEQEANYFIEKTSTAFGNPDLTRIQGMVQGYCMAKGWDYTLQGNDICVKSGKKTIFLIERPCLPPWEIDARRALTNTYREIGR